MTPVERQTPAYREARARILLAFLRGLGVEASPTLRRALTDPASPDDVGAVPSGTPDNGHEAWRLPRGKEEDTQ